MVSDNLLFIQEIKIKMLSKHNSVEHKRVLQNDHIYVHLSR